MDFSPDNFFWITSVILISVSILVIINSLKSFRNKKYRTFTGSYPVSKLTGRDAQLAALLMIMMMSSILMASVLFITNRNLCLALMNYMFNSSISFLTISMVFLVFSIYIYLIIFKDQNLKKMKDTKTTLHLFGRKIF